MLRSDRIHVPVGGSLLVIVSTLFLCYLAVWGSGPIDILARDNFWIDDAYYYLQIARNIGQGKGSTFDGVHKTNGYHPLWLMVLVPIEWFSPGVVGFARISYFIFMLLWLLAWVAMFKVFRLFSSWTSSLICFCFLVHSKLFLHMMMMEAALNILLLVLLFLWIHHASNPVNQGNCLLFAWNLKTGILLGLVFLVRLDNLIIIAMVMVAILLVSFQSFRSNNQWSRFWPACVSVIIPVIVIITYFTLNIKVFGNPFPVSGLAKTSLDMMFNPLHVANIVFVDVPGGVIRKLFSCVGMDREHYQLIAVGWWQVFFSVSYFVLFLLPGITVFYAGKAKKTSNALIAGMYSGVFLHHIQHVIYQHSGQFWGEWHLLPEFLVILIGVSILIDRVSQLVTIAIGSIIKFISGKRCSQKLSVRLISIIVLLFSYWVFIGAGKDRLVEAIYETRKNHVKTSFPSLDAAYYIRDRFTPETKFAAYNSGVTAYFSERTVVNLDGLVNSFDYHRDWLATERPLVEYLNHEKIRYLVDMKEELGNGSEHHYDVSQFEEVEVFGDDKEMQFALWRLKEIQSHP